MSKGTRDTLEEKIAYNDGLRTGLALLLKVLDKSENVRWYHRAGVNLVRTIIIKALDKSYDRANQSHLKGEKLV